MADRATLHFAAHLQDLLPSPHWFGYRLARRFHADGRDAGAWLRRCPDSLSPLLAQIYGVPLSTSWEPSALLSPLEGLEERQLRSFQGIGRVLRQSQHEGGPAPA